MNFQGLGKVEDFQTYLDMAMRAGIQRADLTRSNIKGVPRGEKGQKVEIQRITEVGRNLAGNLSNIGRKFPNLDMLDPFYLELIKCTLDFDQLKKSLGAVAWAQKQISSLTRQFVAKIRKGMPVSQITKTRQAHSGRVSSVMKQIRKDLLYLDLCRKTMKGFPSIKTSRNTIAFAGAPNVGKSTLLASLTNSKPQIAHYPFTTKSLNLGYDTEGRQYIDTPGLLDRPIHKRNKIEQQAILALKHVAKVIIFVLDPTESCGYKLPEQKKLLLELKRNFKIPIILVANKADESSGYKNAINVSAKNGTGIGELKAKIIEELEKIGPAKVKKQPEEN